MLSKKHISCLFFMGILVMSGFAPVIADTFEISNTAVSPLVVQFGDSVEEMAAIAELKSNFPRARVVDFSEFDRIVSFKGAVIYVGHSSDEGILYYGGTVSWDVLVGLIRNSKSNSHYMLGCESSKITELTTRSGKNVFSFNFKVDAIFGSLMISYLLIKTISHTSPFMILLKAMHRLFSLERGLTKGLFLSMSELEIVGHASAFLLLFAFAFMTATASVSSTALRNAVIKVIETSALGLLSTISISMVTAYANYDTGAMLSIAGNIFEMLFTAVYIAVEMVPWYLAAAMVAAAGADVAANTFGAAIKAAMIFTILGISGAFQLYWADRDRHDSNPYYMA
ncbi:MAG: hypothetical protein D6732_25955 [Methanobacteriota archaeon]|nr:MAG: hypothetical protein D6732_25955 [Euryarchaeota archaeon]